MPFSGRYSGTLAATTSQQTLNLSAEIADVGGGSITLKNATAGKVVVAFRASGDPAITTAGGQNTITLAPNEIEDVMLDTTKVQLRYIAASAGEVYYCIGHRREQV